MDEFKEIIQLLRSGVHLGPEEMEGYIEGWLDVELLQAVEYHMAHCVRCREEAQFIQDNLVGESKPEIEKSSTSNKPIADEPWGEDLCRAFVPCISLEDSAETQDSSDSYEEGFYDDDGSEITESALNDEMMTEFEPTTTRAHERIPDTEFASQLESDDILSEKKVSVSNEDSMESDFDVDFDRSISDTKISPYMKIDEPFKSQDTGATGIEESLPSDKKVDLTFDYERLWLGEQEFDLIPEKTDERISEFYVKDLKISDLFKNWSQDREAPGVFPIGIEGSFARPIMTLLSDFEYSKNLGPAIDVLALSVKLSKNETCWLVDNYDADGFEQSEPLYFKDYPRGFTKALRNLIVFVTLGLIRNILYRIKDRFDETSFRDEPLDADPDKKLTEEFETTRQTDGIDAKKSFDSDFKPPAEQPHWNKLRVVFESHYSGDGTALRLTYLPPQTYNDH